MKDPYFLVIINEREEVNQMKTLENKNKKCFIKNIKSYFKYIYILNNLIINIIHTYV